MSEHYLEYPSFVIKKQIQSEKDEEKNLRYSLDIPFKVEPTKNVVVILKNPSIANIEYSDQTANRIIHYCNRKGYDSVSIVNLYAFRATDADVLVDKFQDVDIIGERNDEIILSKCKNAAAIIIAWGKYPNGFREQYDDRIEDVLHKLPKGKVYYVDRTAKGGVYPLHGMVWGYKMEMKKYF